MSVWVELDDLFEAYLKWVENNSIDDGDEYHAAEHRIAFARYIGDVLPMSLLNTGKWELTEQAAHRMRLLLGPYAGVVVKAYHAKRS